MISTTWSALGMLLAAANLPEAYVATANGAPTLFINGKPHPGTSYMTYHPDGTNFRKIGEAGVHLYSFSATPTESTYNLAAPCWVTPEEFDYSSMDDRAHLLLTNDPDAYFFPRIFLGTPPWWAEAHPGDLVQFDPGDGSSQVFELRGKKIASWASEQWRIDTAHAIRRFIQHVEASDYGSRVIGYHIASGTTEEWMQWGSNEDQWSDYSPVSVARFRAWLRERHGTQEALRTAWGDDEVTFETAVIPPRSERAASELGYLRDPAQAQAVIDYVLYTSDLVADTITHFARVAKDETEGKRLVGVFYGYILQLAGAQREQNSGHLAMHEVFSCPHIDFITSPCSYGFRELGTGFPHAMSLVDSIKHHGKLWFDENDLRTWLTPNVEVGKLGKTATFEETLLSQQREFAWTLTNRHGMWWFDMGGGWYDDARMLAEIAKMERIAQECVGLDGRGLDGTSVAEIAFVVDGKSSAYVRPGNPLGWPSLVLQQPRLGRMGAPFDAVHLADLEALPNYKLYIFPNCLAPTAEEGRIIQNKVLDSNATVVWVGPAGVYRNGTLDPSAMTELTGLPLKLQETEAPFRVTPTDAAKPWGWQQPKPYGQGQRGGVFAVPEGDDLTILGRIEGADTPGLVAHQRPNGAWTLFSSVPLLPSKLLRAAAQKAGVHLYIETDDIVWACQDLLAVSVNEAGDRTIRLPEPRTVTDLWTGRTIAEEAASFDLDMAEFGTALLRLK